MNYFIYSSHHFTFSGNNPLMRQLYEVDVPPEALTDRIPPTCPALWRYRTQVTLDHFSHTFQQEVLSTDSESNKILAEFLREVNQLNCIKSSLDSAVWSIKQINLLKTWRHCFLECSIDLDILRLKSFGAGTLTLHKETCSMLSSWKIYKRNKFILQQMMM